MNDALPGVGFSMQQCSLCHMTLFFFLQQQQQISLWCIGLLCEYLQDHHENQLVPAISSHPCLSHVHHVSVLHNSSDHHISNTSLSYYRQDQPAVKLWYNWWRVFEIDKDGNTTHLAGDHINNRYIPSPRRQMISLSSPTTIHRTSPTPDRPPSSSVEWWFTTSP